MKWRNAEIDWHWIGLAAAILRTNYRSICDSVNMGGIYNAYLMFRCSGMSDLPPFTPDFLTLLRLTRQYDVTDSRDRIYGLLGITTDDNDPDTGNLYCQPDYTIKSEELWKRIALKIMQNTQDLSLLSSVQYQREQLESEYCLSSSSGLHKTHTSTSLPSWVPQWDRVFRDSLSPWDSNDKFSATGNMSLIVDKTLESGCLVVEGLQIGMVCHTLRLMWHDVDVSLLWSTHLQPFFKSEAGLRLLMRTFTAGRNAYGSVVPENDTSSFVDFLAFVRSLDSNGKAQEPTGRLWDGGSRLCHYGNQSRDVSNLAVPSDFGLEGDGTRFIETALPFCGNRRLFMTSNGFLGLRPDTLLDGDVLCVLSGGDMPFLLRPLQCGVNTQQVKKSTTHADQ